MVADGLEPVIGRFRPLYQDLLVEDDRFGEQIFLFDLAGDRDIAGNGIAIVLFKHIEAFGQAHLQKYLYFQT